MGNWTVLDLFHAWRFHGDCIYVRNANDRFRPCQPTRRDCRSKRRSEKKQEETKGGDAAMQRHGFHSIVEDVPLPHEAKRGQMVFHKDDVLGMF